LFLYRTVQYSLKEEQHWIIIITEKNDLSEPATTVPPMILSSSASVLPARPARRTDNRRRSIRQEREEGATSITILPANTVPQNTR
jgi:hypothetical protein